MGRMGSSVFFFLYELISNQYTMTIQVKILFLGFPKRMKP